MRVELTTPRENHGAGSWVVSIQRSPVPASLHLSALQLNLSGLRAPEHPLFTPSVLVLILVTRQGRKGKEYDRQRRGQFCRSVGAKSTTQHGRADPLSPNPALANAQ